MSEKIYKTIKTRDWVAEMEADRNEEIAELLYTEYSVAVGGFGFNGDPLPEWEEFRADITKKKQSDAWIAVAKLARSIELE